MGMLATLALFVIRLSRVDVIAEEFTGRDRRSTMLRSVPDRAILYDRGELLRGYRLRGYIFFGSAHPLIDELKRRLAWPRRTDAIVNLTGAQLNFLLDGYDIWRMRPHQQLRYASMY